MRRRAFFRNKSIHNVLKIWIFNHLEWQKKANLKQILFWFIHFYNELHIYSITTNYKYVQ